MRTRQVATITAISALLMVAGRERMAAAQLKDPGAPPPPSHPTTPNPAPPLVTTSTPTSSHDTPSTAAGSTATTPVGSSKATRLILDDQKAPLTTYCQRNKDPKKNARDGEVCEFIDALPSGYPFSFYKARIKAVKNVDVCGPSWLVEVKTKVDESADKKGAKKKVVESASAKAEREKEEEKEKPAVNAYLRMNQMCDASGLKSGVLDIGVNAVQGLGDFLVARAKKELAGFAIESAGRKICDKDLIVVPGAKGGKVEPFEQTCVTLFPAGTKGDPDLDVVADGRLQLALRADLVAMPEKLIKVGLPQGTDENTKDLTRVVEAFGHALYQVVRSGRPSDLFADVMEAFPESKATHDMACDLGTNRSAACITLLLVDLGDVAIKQADKGTVNGFDVIDRAAADFCGRFSTKNDPPGACVLAAVGYETWQPLLVSFVRDSLDLHDTAVKASALSAGGAVGAAQPSAPAGSSLSDSIDEVFDSLVEAVTKKVDPGNDKVIKILAVLRSAERITTGVIDRSEAKVIAAVLDVVRQGGVLEQLGIKEGHAVSLLVSVAMAESRADVEAVLEDQAAPLGSYAAKYGDGGRNRLAVNGYVGAFAGALRIINEDGYVGSRTQFFYRLSAPVGFDWTIVGGSLFHFGIGMSAIDPLALTVLTKDGTLVKANWASLFDLGVYMRVGLFHSPLSLLAAGQYLPGLTSSDTCMSGTVSQPCWRGAWQLGLALSVDIPLWLLN